MIQASELIINPDGSIFHLHLKPDQLADQVILVGDPGRVDLIASFFSRVEFITRHREFVSATGWYKGVRVTVVATGIGTDNIDIVVNELDALANIDLKTRTVKSEHRKLKLIRIGTSGALQADIPVNSYVISEKAIGFDGLLNFYANRNQVSDLKFEDAFKEFTGWSSMQTSPYVVDCSAELMDKLQSNGTISGITISAPGFYGPQGRVLRLPLADESLNEKIEKFRYGKYRVTNYEMECSAIYGLGKLLGHEVLTICLIIANRVTKQANEDYKPHMRYLAEHVLNCLAIS